MKTEQQQSKQCTDSKKTFVAGLFYLFVILTGVAFLLRLFSLDWFDSTIVDIEEPDKESQWIILGLLKTFELVFTYKILTKGRFFICILIAVIQTIVTPWLGAGFVQSLADFFLMFIIPLIMRKDKINALVDVISLNIIMCLYGLLFLIGKFGVYSSNQIYSFYANVLGMMDYKLFIVTLYLYIEFKGGIQVWKMKRKLFQ